MDEGEEEEEGEAAPEPTESAQGLRGLSQASGHNELGMRPTARRTSISQNPRMNRLNSKQDFRNASQSSSRQTQPKQQRTLSTTQNDEIKKYEEQIKQQLSELEPSRRMTKDTNFLSAMEQCQDNLEAQEKVKSEYTKYFQQEYEYYYTYYQQQLQKIKSGNPVDAAVPQPTPSQPAPSVEIEEKAEIAAEMEQPEPEQPEEAEIAEETEEAAPEVDQEEEPAPEDAGENPDENPE